MEIQNAWYRMSVKALIYNSERKLMLCKEESGVWDLPGGGLDHGEYVLDCIKRELREEMNLDVILIDPVPKVFIAANKPASKTRPWIANICYEVEVKDFNFTPSDECIEIGFFTLDEISTLNTLVNVDKIVEELSK